MHIPDRHGVVAKVAGKHYLALTAQEKSCVTLLDVVCNIGWSFGRDGEPKTKPVMNSIQQSAVILYQCGIEVDMIHDTALVRKAHHAGSPACSRGLRSSLTEDGEFHQAPLWGLLVSGGIGTWQAMLDLNEIMSSPFAAADQLVTGLDSWHPSWRAIQRHSYKKLLTNERGKSEEEAASAKCPAAPTFLHTAAKVPAPLILQGATLQI
ncbi:hypothetical protein KXV68_009377 [Aspergillus fumigatus]|nr:hypothetical protein KXX13_006532 [Aspergillus fumigatus]KAH1524130.1 hypothetical protein KXX29_005333 [Aspergillus fumigatus]KAH1643570.1 hypothetical protein KXX39_003211 [Aspergillus fumigatus]KAH1936876.1 hypothetical protein KXV48_009261 [Aspergillus fumigatus]KAH1946566.1 hypothetical protein KXV90_003307 [Aspergillus fumigatus]